MEIIPISGNAHKYYLSRICTAPFSNSDLHLKRNKIFSNVCFNPSNAEATFVQCTRRKHCWKPYKPCHVGIDWLALMEYSQWVPICQGFNDFSGFLHHFALANLASSSIRIEVDISKFVCPNIFLRVWVSKWIPYTQLSRALHTYIICDLNKQNIANGALFHKVTEQYPTNA